MSDVSFAVYFIDNVFLDALEDSVLHPDFIDQVLDATFAHDHADERAHLEQECDR